MTNLARAISLGRLLMLPRCALHCGLLRNRKFELMAALASAGGRKLGRANHSVSSLAGLYVTNAENVLSRNVTSHTPNAKKARRVI